MTIDTEQFRGVLLEERTRVQAALENLREETAGTLYDDAGEESAYDNHLADTATETYDRELDYTLEENSEHVLGEIDAALHAHRGGHLRHLHELRQADPRGAARGASLGDALHRLPAQPGARLTERVTTRPTDVRVGSTTDGLTPISVAERKYGASWPQWLSLGSVALAALGADQLTKSIVTSRLDFNDQVHVAGPFSIHHVTNSGIAFGLFASATSLVILLTALAVAWMLYFFARSGSRHPVLPVALGLVIGGSVSNLLDRVRLGHVTDFLDFRYWPAFNLADTFIVVGVAALLLALVASDRNAGRPQRVRETLRVPDEAAGERLDRFLASLPEVGSRSVAERLLEAQAVLVDGKSLAKSRRLVGGEELEFDPPERDGAAELVPEPMDLRIAYEDEISSSSTSRPGSSFTRHPGMQPGRSSTGCSSTTSPAEMPTGPASCTGSTATRRG